MKNREERIKRITNISSLITGLVISIYGYVLFFINSFENTWVRLGIVTVFIIITFIIIYFGREKFFNKIFQMFWKSDSKDKSILGEYELFIFFNDNEHYDRSGTLELKDSYAGLYISGNNLTDNKAIVTVEKWYAQEAEIYHYADNRIILVYQYWLQEDSIVDKHNKLGIVIAISDDGGKSFKGSFKDIALEDGKITRLGKVIINKFNSST